MTGWLFWAAALMLSAVLFRPLAALLRLGGRTALSLGLLAALGQTGLLAQAGLGVNLVNAVTLGVLGLPGLGLLLMGRWLLG